MGQLGLLAMSEWKGTRLGDILTVHHGYAFTSEPCRDALNDGTPKLIRIGDFARRRGSAFESSRPQEFVGEYPERFNLQPGDLLIAMTCQSSDGSILGWPMVVPADGAQYLHNQRLGRIEVLADSQLDRMFAFYLFRSDWMNHELFVTASGSKILHTAPDRIRSVQVPLPSLPEQRRIAAVLGSFDDLIETDEEIATSCNSLWRVAVQAAAETRGIEELPLSDLASFINGKNFTKDAVGTGLPVIRTPEVRNGPTSSTVRRDKSEVNEDNLANAGDILFVWSGSLLVGRWRWEPGLVNQHIFKVLPKERVPDWLALWAIEQLMDDFLGGAADKATTMGHIKRGDLDRMVALPPRALWPRLDATVRPLWDMALGARIEADELARTRDELLPLLMSGKVRVDERLQVVA
jgi:type I restriction enzyme S subunit